MLFQEVDPNGDPALVRAFRISENGETLTYAVQLGGNSLDAERAYLSAKQALDNEECALGLEEIERALSLDSTRAEYYCCRAELRTLSYSGNVDALRNNLNQILFDLEQSVLLDPSGTEARILKDVLVSYWLPQA